MGGGDDSESVCLEFNMIIRALLQKSNYFYYWFKKFSFSWKPSDGRNNITLSNGVLVNPVGLFGVRNAAVAVLISAVFLGGPYCQVLLGVMSSSYTEGHFCCQGYTL